VESLTESNDNKIYVTLFIIRDKCLCLICEPHLTVLSPISTHTHTHPHKHTHSLAFKITCFQYNLIHLTFWFLLKESSKVFWFKLKEPFKFKFVKTDTVTAIEEVISLIATKFLARCKNIIVIANIRKCGIAVNYCNF
jgi:hypothetical protein